MRNANLHSLKNHEHSVLANVKGKASLFKEEDRSALSHQLLMVSKLQTPTKANS